MEFEISNDAYAAASAEARRVGIPRPGMAPLPLTRPLHQSRFQAARGVQIALTTLARWQRKPDYLLESQVREAQGTLARALLDAYPVLGLHRRLIEAPTGSHTALRVAIQGTKALNDAAGASEVDAEFLPAVHALLEASVDMKWLPNSPSMKVDFAAQDYKGALLVCHAGLDDTIAWKTGLDQKARPALTTLVHDFLTRAAKREPRREGKILALRDELTSHPSALMHLGIQPIPQDANPLQLVQAVAGADTSAKLDREYAHLSEVDHPDRGVFTSEKIAGALAQVKELAERLARRTILVDGTEQPVMVRRHGDGEPQTILNQRLLRLLRKGNLPSMRPTDDKPVNDLRRLVELTGLVDFVYYGRRVDMERMLPLQLKVANELFDGLLVGQEVDVAQLGELLMQSSSGAAVSQAGKPSAYPFYQLLSSQREYALVAFDLDGFGATLQNIQFQELLKLAEETGPVTEDRHFRAKTDVNDAAQDHLDRFHALGHRAMGQTLWKGSLVLRATGAPKETYEPLFNSIPPRMRLPLDTAARADEISDSLSVVRLPNRRALRGGDELTFALPATVVRNPLIQDILFSQTKAMKVEMDVRCTFASVSTEAGETNVEAAYDEVNRRLDGGMQQMKTIEGLWESIADKSRSCRALEELLTPAAGDDETSLPSALVELTPKLPFIYDADAGHFHGYVGNLNADEFEANLRAQEAKVSERLVALQGRAKERFPS